MHKQDLSLPWLEGKGQRRRLVRRRSTSTAAQVLPVVRTMGRVAAWAEAINAAAARRGASMVGKVVCGVFGILWKDGDEARNGRVDTGSEEPRTKHRGVLCAG
jgi:hypothetical protein